MATIEKIQRQSGTVYKAKVRKQGHPTTTRTFKTRTAAKRWAAKFEGEIEEGDAGITLEGQKHSLSDAIKQYREQLLPDLRPETRRKYEQHLDFWEPKLGHLRLFDCRPEKIATVRDELTATGKAPATVNRYMATLAAVFAATVKRWHWLQVSPMQQIAKPVERNSGTRYLSDDELQRLLAACRESTSPDLYLAVVLSITTGARQGEILGLRWRDVDLSTGVLYLRADADTVTKGSVRSVPIAAVALPLLKSRQEAQQKAQEGKVQQIRDRGLVFPSRVSRMQPVLLHRPWTTAVNRAGIESFRWHDLRHSAASFLAKSGASLIEIGAILGHKSANTTKRYSHLTQQHTHDLVRKLADTMFGGGE